MNYEVDETETAQNMSAQTMLHRSAFRNHDENPPSALVISSVSADKIDAQVQLITPPWYQSSVFRAITGMNRLRTKQIDKINGSRLKMWRAMAQFKPLRGEFPKDYFERVSRKCTEIKNQTRSLGKGRSI